MRLFRKLQSSLKYKIFLCLLFLILIPYLILNAYFYSAAESVIREKIIITTAKALHQTCINVENIITFIVSGSNIIARENDVQQIIVSAAADNSLAGIKNHIYMQNLFNQVQGSIFSVTSDIQLLAPNGEVFSTGLFDTQKADGLYSSAWYQNTLSRKYLYNWFQLKKSDLGLISNKDDELIVMSRTVEGAVGNDSGVLLVAIKKAQINEIMRSLVADSRESYFIADSSGKIILSSQASSDGTRLDSRYNEILQKDNGYFSFKDSNQEYLVNYMGISFLDWKIAIQSPYASVFAEINRLRQQILFMNILFIFPFTIIILLLFTRFLKPVSSLVALMHQVEKGDLSQRVPVKSEDELGVMTNQFNIMLTKLSHLIEEDNKKQQRIADQQKEKETMRYLVLKSQITPHFLFNALNNIKWLAMINHSKTVADSISSLGHLLEASIRDANDEIPLRQELSYLKDYIHIMELSKPGKFTVTCQIDEQVLDCKVAKLILQPLVENAIIHGFRDMTDPGEIQIIGYRQDAFLIIEILDNGVGFRDADIDQILSRSLPLNKLGVGNTNQRIKLYCGDSFGLKIYPRQPSGTRVVLTLPFHDGAGAELGGEHV